MDLVPWDEVFNEILIPLPSAGLPGSVGDPKQVHGKDVASQKMSCSRATKQTRIALK